MVFLPVEGSKYGRVCSVSDLYCKSEVKGRLDYGMVCNVSSLNYNLANGKLEYGMVSPPGLFCNPALESQNMGWTAGSQISSLSC